MYHSLKDGDLMLKLHRNYNSQRLIGFPEAWLMTPEDMLLPTKIGDASKWDNNLSEIIT